MCIRDRSIGGTLTKQDVTNVDSIGVITARNRIDMTQGYQLGWKSGSTERARIHGDSGSNFIIETGGTPTERVRVTSSGRVGIGSNSPKTSLDVAGLVNLVNGSPEVHFTTGAAHYNWRVAAQEVVDEGFEIASGTQSADGVNDTYSTKLVLKADGKLGINKTNPSGMLHISGDNNSNGPELYLNVNNNNTTDNIGALIYGNNADNTVLKIQGVTHTANNTGDLTFHTSTTGTMGERLRITSDGKIGIQTNAPTDAWLDIASSAGTDSLRMRRLSSDVNVASNWALKPYGKNLYFREGSSSPYDRVHFTDTGNVVATGAISDSKGELRAIPRELKGSAYTLVIGDAGKCIAISSGGITVPHNVLGTGHAVTIINNSGSDQTITQAASLSLYNTADGSTGNRTLAGRGMATIWFSSGAEAYISGSGLS